MDALEFSSLLSALIDNISAGFFLPPTPMSLCAHSPSSVPSSSSRVPTLSPRAKIANTSQPIQGAVISDKEPVIIKKRSRKSPLLPSQFKSFISSCTLCSDASENYSSLLPDSLPSKPYIMVITDLHQSDEESSYLSTILSSIRLSPSSSSDVYSTFLFKCKGGKGSLCFAHLVDEIDLVCPYAILVFGSQCAELFSSSLHPDSLVWNSRSNSYPITIIPKNILDIKDDKSLKSQLWKNLKLYHAYFMKL